MSYVHSYGTSCPVIHQRASECIAMLKIGGATLGAVATEAAASFGIVPARALVGIFLTSQFDNGEKLSRKYGHA